jgi:hypothetical protein
MRTITQEEAERMRAVLKEIASFGNPSAVKDRSQAAANRARELLDELGLFYETDINK